jgi:hypothetical protein
MPINIADDVIREHRPFPLCLSRLPSQARTIRKQSTRTQIRPPAELASDK